MKIYYTHDHKGGRGESRLLLAHSIGSYTGSAQRAEELMSSLTVYGAYGKPVIPGFDHFSVSHSGTTWAVLFSGDICGLDIQYERECSALSLAERFYAPEDSYAVSKAFECGSDRAAEVFFRIWTRREALVKAAGTSAAAADIPSVTDDTVEYEGRNWILRDIEVPETQKLHAAVCLDAEGAEAYRGEPGFIRLELQGIQNGRIY